MREIYGSMMAAARWRGPVCELRSEDEREERVRPMGGWALDRGGDGVTVTVTYGDTHRELLLWK